MCDYRNPLPQDVKVVGSEMESCLPAKHHFFAVGRKKGSLFIREEEVMLESDFGTDNSQQPPDQLPRQPPQSHRREQDGHRPTPYSQRQPSSQPPQQQQYQEEKQHGAQRDPAHHGRGHGESLDVGDTRKLAEQMGVGSPTQLMQEQSELLQKAAEEKKGRELKDIRQALHLDPAASLHVEDQAKLMRQYSEGKRQNEMQKNNGVDNHLYDVITTPPSSRRADSQPRQSHDPNLAHPLAQPPGYPPQQQQQQGHFQQQGYPQQQMDYQHQQGYPPHTSPPQQALHQPNTQQPSHHPAGQHVAYAGHPDLSHSAGLGVDSPVQLKVDPSRTGVIRWMGTLPETKGRVAGVELVSHLTHMMGDFIIMHCSRMVQWMGVEMEFGKDIATFPVSLAEHSSVPLHPYYQTHVSLRLARWEEPPQGTVSKPSPVTQILPLMAFLLSSALQAPDWEDEDQLINPGQIVKYIGDGRGIQGHQNSCYLDATIFGLFALSDVFDSLFLENSLMSLKSSQLSSAVSHVQSDISHMLWRGIVNPLRKLGK